MARPREKCHACNFRKVVKTFGGGDGPCNTPRLCYDQHGAEQPWGGTVGLEPARLTQGKPSRLHSAVISSNAVDHAVKLVGQYAKQHTAHNSLGLLAKPQSVLWRHNCRRHGWPRHTREAEGPEQEQ